MRIRTSWRSWIDEVRQRFGRVHELAGGASIDLEVSSEDVAELPKGGILWVRRV